jgi:transposase-like protein
MVSKGFTPEQIINKLREAEIHINRGISIAETSRKIGITQQTYYRWRKEYNQISPHSSMNYQPPAPEARIPATLT